MSLYHKIYKHVLFPMYETRLCHRQTLTYLAALERNQWLPLNQIRQIQWEKLQALLRHIYENVPFYQRRFQQAGLTPEGIRNYEDFRRLPLLSKRDVQLNYDQLIAVNYAGKNGCSNETSGSTGEPIKFVFARESYERRVAAAMRANKWSGWDYGKKMTMIWGTGVNKKSFKQKTKIIIHHALMRRQFVNAFEICEDELPAIIARIRMFKPVLVEAYVSALYTIAQFIRANNVEPFRPQAIITGAEMLHDYQRKLIEDVFGCRIFNRYGCSEVMLIGAECEEHNGMHLNIDSLYVEFLRDGQPVADGESGEIVVTDLNNYGMPFVRYRMKDLGAPTSRPCPCGRGLPLMERIEGRSVDIFLTANGKFIQPQMFCWLFPEYDWIKQYQLVQMQKGEMTIRVVKGREFSAEEKDGLIARIKHIIADPIDLKLEIVPDIPLSKSGKYRLVVSKTGLDLGN